jgi:predicted TIM-barrel fold metal-dependent hydrolase
MSAIADGVFDCDTHIYEARDAVTRYLPEEYRDRAIRPVKNENDQDVVFAGERLATFTSEDGLGFDHAYRPGSLRQMLKEMGSGNPESRYQPEPMRPEYIEREPRLRLLDEQGVARCVLFPGSLALSGEHYVDDTDALYANLSSFNRWYDETWGFNYQDRLYATAMLSLRDIDRAVALTDEVLARGARVVVLPTGPAYGRSPGDPYFDPVWSRLNEAGVVVALHIMPFWYFDAISPAWGHDPDPQSWRMSAWQWMNTYGERPVIDTISALIFDNLFERFPQLHLLIAEHGASWVPHMLQHMDKSRGMGRNGPWLGGQLQERPSTIFKQHVRVVPYPEDDTMSLIERLGTDQTLLMGSDWPHAEGLREPAEFYNRVDGLDETTKRNFLRENGMKLTEGID